MYYPSYYTLIQTPTYFLLCLAIIIQLIINHLQSNFLPKFELWQKFCIRRVTPVGLSKVKIYLSDFKYPCHVAMLQPLYTPSILQRYMFMVAIIVIVHSMATTKSLANWFQVLNLLGCVDPKSNFHFSWIPNSPPMYVNIKNMQLTNVCAYSKTNFYMIYSTR